MPVPVSEAELAASPGHDPKRDVARRRVALEFFQQHVWEADRVKDWSVVQRALQCIDYGRPVVIGPEPPAPRRLFAIDPAGPLGAGFFSEEAPARDDTSAWIVAPEAVYLRFCAPSLRSDPKARQSPPIRYFVPGARAGKGPRVVTKERA